jgi:hypothetical protein
MVILVDSDTLLPSSLGQLARVVSHAKSRACLSCATHAGRGRASTLAIGDTSFQVNAKSEVAGPSWQDFMNSNRAKLSRNVSPGGMLLLGIHGIALLDSDYTLRFGAQA